METAIWLAVCSALLTVIGAMASIGYRHIIKSIQNLEHQDKKLYAAIMTSLVAKADDHVAIANAIHGLLQNGIKGI